MLLVNVTKNKVTIANDYVVNRGEYKVNKIQFAFTEDYSGLVKKAIFKDSNNAIEQAIINDECDIPYEVLNSTKIELRVYGYEVANEELVLRYSPQFTYILTTEGSYIAPTGQGEEITPTQFEQYEQALNDGLEEVANVDIDANKEGHTTTVTITNRNAVTKEVEILDGEKGQDGKDGKDGEDYVITQEDYQEIANVVKSQIDIPTKTSDLQNDSGYINNNVDDLTNYYKKADTYSKTEIDTKISSVYKYKGSVATYSDLPSTDLTIGDVYNVESDGSNYAWNGTQWDKLGGDIDLSNYYNKTQTDSLLAGKQNIIDTNNKLASNLVDDSNSVNKFVTTSEKTTWNAKYDKPNTGIPKTDLASDVQTSLGKADTAIQTHQDISGKEDKSNKVTSLSSSSTDTQYPSAKLVYDELASRDAEIDIVEERMDVVEEIMPTISATGTEITLQNTKKAGMKVALGGNTEQASTTGKNIFHQRETTTNNGVTYTKNADGSYNIKGTASPQANLYVNIPIGETEIISGETYTLSVNKTFPNSMTIIVEGYNGSTWVRNHVRVNTGETSATAVIDLSGTTTVRQTIRVYDGSTIDIENLQIQLEKSSTPSSYEPYTGGIASPNPDYPQDIHTVTGNNTITVAGVNYPINLGTIELCKIGNNQDYIYKSGDKWYKHSEIGEISYNGSENWAAAGTQYEGLFSANITVSNLKRQNIFSGDLYSNYFTEHTFQEQNEGITKSSRPLEYSVIILRIKNDKATNLNTFKSWLSTHNTTVYYILATPTNTEITDTTLISQLEALYLAKSANGQTNITQTNADEPFILTATAFENIDMEGYVRDTDYATDSKAGVIKATETLKVSDTGVMYADTLTYTQYKTKSNGNIIGKGTLDNVITGKGLVSDTDYATIGKGGVVKIDSNNYGLNVNAQGILYSRYVNYSSYKSANQNFIISKGTLENVIAGRFVTLTQSQYDQLTPEANTFYFITD